MYYTLDQVFQIQTFAGVTGLCSWSFFKNMKVIDLEFLKGRISSIK